MDDQAIPEWKQFEIAVAEFLRALDPSAKVTHDAKTPDLHTGKPRQRDVWIEGTLCRLFPIKVLVSCKFTADRIDEQDIDAFNGEFIASRANKGVIYARTGFTKEAIDKAKVLGFSCCRLYANQPPEIPEVLFFSSSYCSRNQGSLIFVERPDPVWRLTDWSDLFNAAVLVGNMQEIALDVLCTIYEHCIEESLGTTKAQGGVPAPWIVDVELKHPNAAVNPLKVRLGGRWRTWVAKAEAHLLNGTYSLTDGQFVGTQTGPVVDTWGIHPGPDWTECEPPIQSPANTCHFFIRGKTRETLVDVLGPQPIQIAEPPGPREPQKEGPAGKAVPATPRIVQGLNEGSLAMAQLEQIDDHDMRKLLLSVSQNRSVEMNSLLDDLQPVCLVDRESDRIRFQALPGQPNQIIVGVKCAKRLHVHCCAAAVILSAIKETGSAQDRLVALAYKMLNWVVGLDLQGHLGVELPAGHVLRPTGEDFPKELVAETSEADLKLGTRLYEFAFSAILLHELGHLKLGHTGEVGLRSIEQEKEADRFAAEWLTDFGQRNVDRMGALLGTALALLWLTIFNVFLGRRQSETHPEGYDRLFQVLDQIIDTSNELECLAVWEFVRRMLRAHMSSAGFELDEAVHDNPRDEVSRLIDRISSSERSVRD